MHLASPSDASEPSPASASASASLAPPVVQMESKLLKYLMRNYDREVRPVIDPKTAMVVNVGITLTQIFDMVSRMIKGEKGISLSLSLSLFVRARELDLRNPRGH